MSLLANEAEIESCEIFLLLILSLYLLLFAYSLDS